MRMAPNWVASPGGVEMAETLRLYHVDSFTKRRFSGNPAGVITNADGLSERQMQAIARELNMSETAFVFSPTGPDYRVSLRFFTPTIEVPTCGHATIAAFYVLGLERPHWSGSVAYRCGVGLRAVDIEEKGSLITMHQGHPEFGECFPQESLDDLLKALSLTPDRSGWTVLPIQKSGYRSTGSFVVPLKQTAGFLKSTTTGFFAH